MTKTDKQLTPVEERLALLFRKIWSTDCQSTFNVSEVSDMLRDCFAFPGDRVESGERIVGLTSKEKSHV